MRTQLQKNRSSNKGETGRALVLLFILVVVSTLLSSAYAQVARVKPPKGGFAIDGNLRANTPTSPSPFAPNQGDWIWGTGGTGDSVLRAVEGTPFDPLTTGHVIDFYHGSDNIFTSGSKFNDYISDLQWVPGASAPDKDDINNGLYHVSTDSVNGEQWLFIAGDRLSVKGTSYIDFELLQGSVTTTSTNNVYRFAGSGPNGGRTSGDIDISMSYTNGGSKPTVTIYRWKYESGTDKWMWDSSGSSNVTNAFAETNRTGSVDVPFKAFGSATYQQYSFVEAAINISQLLGTAGNCQGIKIHTLWIKTKASASSTAALKDFISPVAVDFSFGEVEMTSVASLCVNADSVTLQASPSGGSFSGDGVSGNSFNPATAGVGDHVITYTATLGIGCTKYDTIHITVLPLPTASISGTTDVCKDDNSPYVVLTGTNGTRPYTFTYNINGGTSLTKTTTGTNDTVRINAPTGTVGTFTYNLTGVSDGSCSDTASGNAVITVNPLPTATAGDAPAAQCYMAGGNTFTLSGNGTNGNPSWAVKSNPDGLVVNITGGNTYSPSVKVTASTNGGSVVLRLTVTSTYSCGIDTSDVTLTVNAQQNGPAVDYIAPACYESTFKITVNGLQEKDTVTVVDKNGDPIITLSPQSPFTVPASTTSKTFAGIPAGYGYRVTLSRGGCVSLPTSCISAASTVKLSEQNVKQIPLADDSKLQVKAYPNPFNDHVKFVVTAPNAGEGSLEIFNTLGQKVKTVYQGHILAGTQSFELTVPKKQQATLLYVFILGSKKLTGKLLQLN